MLSIRLRPHSDGESVAANDSQLVNSAGDQFVLVSCFKLQRDNRSVRVNYAGLTRHKLSQRRWRQVVDVDVRANRTFMIFQDRQYGLAEAAEAMRHQEQGHAQGKTVITV